MAGAGGGALLTRTRPLLSASQPGPRANSRWVSCLLPPSPPACTAIASYLASPTPLSLLPPSRHPTHPYTFPPRFLVPPSATESLEMKSRNKGLSGRVSWRGSDSVAKLVWLVA